MLASFLAALSRGGLMFRLIIWLQGIWQFARYYALPGVGHCGGNGPDTMSADSVLLLIDRLLPDHFADTPEHRRDASADIMMMAHWGQERSQQEMFTLLDSAGLRPVRVVGQAWSISVVEVRTK